MKNISVEVSSYTVNYDGELKGVKGSIQFDLYANPWEIDTVYFDDMEQEYNYPNELPAELVEEIEGIVKQIQRNEL